MNIFTVIGTAANWMGARPRRAILATLGYIAGVIALRELYFLVEGFRWAAGILRYLTFIVHLLPAVSLIGACVAFVLKYEFSIYDPPHRVLLNPTPEQAAQIAEEKKKQEKKKKSIEAYRKTSVVRFVLTDNSIPMAIVRALILVVMIKNTPAIYNFLRYPTMTAEWFTRNYYLICVIAINLYEFIVFSCIFGIWRTITMRNFHKVIEVEERENEEKERLHKEAIAAKEAERFSPEAIARREALKEQRAREELAAKQNVWWAAISSWHIGIDKHFSDEFTKCVEFNMFESNIHNAETWLALFAIKGMSLEKLNKIIKFYNRDFHTRIKYLSVAEINVAMANSDKKLPANVTLIDYFPDSPAANGGEAKVDYQLKWWNNKNSQYKKVEKDCKSQYSEACLRIANWDCIKEPQELDHLLIGPAGVIHIETKNYSGNIDVIDNNTWNRDYHGSGDWEKTSSPAFQIERHERVLKSIVGEDIPVYSIICIANDKTEIFHAENSAYTIVDAIHLSEVLDKIHSEAKTPLSGEAIAKVAEQIENAKVKIKIPTQPNK